MKASEKISTAKSILVLTDFSDRSKNATDYATNLAIQVNADVVLFNAYLIPDVGFDSWPTEDEPNRSKQSLSKLDEETTRLRGIVDNQQGTFKPKIESMSLEGAIAENVIAIMKERQNILMVVMGGYKGNSRDDMHFGVEITEVLCKVNCPTMIIP